MVAWPVNLAVAPARSAVFPIILRPAQYHFDKSSSVYISQSWFLVLAVVGPRITAESEEAWAFP